MLKNNSVKSIVVGVLAASFLVVHPGVLFAADICIPSVGGLAGSPFVDGMVEGDLGWNGAVQINLDENKRELSCPTCTTYVVSSGTPRDAFLSVGTTASDVYLGLRIAQPQLAANTTVVLTLAKNDATTGASDEWKIHIRPGTLGTTGHPLEVKYWRDSSGWNSETYALAVAGQWLIDNITYNDQGANGWQLEMKIPRAGSAAVAGPGLTEGIYFPPANKFRMYVNVLSTFAITGAYNQDPWPAGIVILPGTSNSLERLTPDKTMWGIASLYGRGECTGVSLAWDKIGVLNAGGTIGQTITALTAPTGGYPGTDFDGNGVKDVHDCQALALADNYNWPATQGPLNRFIARPTNSMTQSGKVSASFYVASWGIPGVSDWKKIGDLYPVSGGVSNNPTSESTIPAKTGSTDGTVDLESQWGLSFKQSCTYALSNGGHHCIQVDLDSSDLNTVLLNRSVQRNMDFVPASVFERKATISTRGLEKPSGNASHEYILAVESRRQAYSRDGSYYPRLDKNASTPSYMKKPIPASYFANGLTEAYYWIARGYVKTGDKLIINGSPYTYAKSTGSFGYIAGHNGEVKNWDVKLTNGPNDLNELQKGSGVYVMNIPAESEVTVGTRIEAVEPNTCKRTPCSPCPPKTAGSSLLIGMVGIGGAAGIGFKPRRRKEEKVQEKEK